MKWVKLIFVLFIGIQLSCSSQIAENNIVLIGVDTLDREGISKVISIVNGLKPQVIAIDVQFVNETDHKKDWSLFNELTKCKNLIMGSAIWNYTGKDLTYDRFFNETEPQFLINAKTGFTNAIFTNDKHHKLIKFSSHEKVNGNLQYHFSIAVAMAFDSLKAVHFVKNSPKVVDIDFRNGKRKFKTFPSSDILGRKLTFEDIEGKIVMLGFLGPGDEDKFFTPLNTKSDVPDMYGLEYLANVTAQILETR